MNVLNKPHEHSSGRMAVLLGAGASANAELPLTSALAKAVIDEANKDDQRHDPGRTGDRVRALNAVYAGMVGYQGARGESPLTAVNIETLISAVRLLAKRDSHEVAPFVATWSASLSNFSTRNFPTSSSNRLMQAINRSQSPGAEHPREQMEISEAVASIALSAVKPDMSVPFKDAEEFILETLVHLLGDPGDVSYLNPLINLSQTQDQGLDIVTLNYDLTVEKAARNLDVDYFRGVENWTPGDRLHFPDDDKSLNIIKLHGSLDWRSNVYTDVNLGPLLPRGVEVVEMENLRRSGRRELPWIVVGDRDKLGTDGPTLELNFAARNAISRADHLLVVGYSFSDTHVNAIIRDWLANRNELRTITVLDREWPVISDRDYQKASFKNELIWEYGQIQDRLNHPVKPRMAPVSGEAKYKLEAAIRLRPGWGPEGLLAAEARRESDVVSVVATWYGPDLRRVQVAAAPVEGVSSEARKITLFPSHPPSKRKKMEDIYSSPAMLSSWESGGQRTVYARSDAPDSFLLRVSGDSVLGRQDAYIHLRVAGTEHDHS